MTPHLRTRLAKKGRERIGGDYGTETQVRDGGPRADVFIQAGLGLFAEMRVCDSVPLANMSIQKGLGIIDGSYRNAAPGDHEVADATNDSLAEALIAVCQAGSRGERDEVQRMFTTVVRLSCVKGLAASPAEASALGLQLLSDAQSIV